MKAVKQRVGVTFLAVLSFAAQAHPHSFISLQSEVIARDGQIVGLNMRWTMDEITSADLLYDAGDAKPGDEIWKKLAAEVMANVLGQHYFTEVWHNGVKVKFQNRPIEYALARDGHQAVLTFGLPLIQPQPLAGQTYTFSSFDSSWYVDMRYAHDKDAALPVALQKLCKVTVHTPQPDEQVLNYAQALDKANAPPEDMELGKQFAQTVTLICQ